MFSSTVVSGMKGKCPYIADGLFNYDRYARTLDKPGTKDVLLWEAHVLSLEEPYIAGTTVVKKKKPIFQAMTCFHLWFFSGEFL